MCIESLDRDDCPVFSFRRPLTELWHVQVLNEMGKWLLHVLTMCKPFLKHIIREAQGRNRHFCDNSAYPPRAKVFKGFIARLLLGWCLVGTLLLQPNIIEILGDHTVLVSPLFCLPAQASCLTTKWSKTIPRLYLYIESCLYHIYICIHVIYDWISMSSIYIYMKPFEIN